MKRIQFLIKSYCNLDLYNNLYISNLFVSWYLNYPWSSITLNLTQLLLLHNHFRKKTTTAGFNLFYDIFLSTEQQNSQGLEFIYVFSLLKHILKYGCNTHKNITLGSWPFCGRCAMSVLHWSLKCQNWRKDLIWDKQVKTLKKTNASCEKKKKRLASRTEMLT